MQNRDEREEDRKNRLKKGKIQFAAGVLLQTAFVISFGIGISLDYDGPLYLIHLAVFFAGLILLGVGGGVLNEELERKLIGKYGRQEFTRLERMGKAQVEDKLAVYGFREEQGYFGQYKLSGWLLTRIWYDFRLLEHVDMDKWTISLECDSYKRGKNRRKIPCRRILIVIAYMDAFGERERDYLRKFNIRNFRRGFPKERYSELLIMVDPWTEQGYFLDTSQNRKSCFYAHACRIVKKIFSKEGNIKREI